jgi:hypothetical protein
MSTEEKTPAAHPERARAEELFAKVEDHLTSADEAELGEAEEFRSLAWAQVHLLKAIYHELRHGHDQTRREIEALAKHTAALDEHADAMDGLKRGMYYEGDMHSRRR